VKDIMEFNLFLNSWTSSQKVELECKGHLNPQVCVGFNGGGKREELKSRNSD